MTPQLASPPKTHRDEVLQGMRCVDTTGNPRIPVLMEMVGALSRQTEARDVLRVFSEGLIKIYGQRGYISLSVRGLKPGEYRVTRAITDIGDTTSIATADPWANLKSMPIHRDGFFGEIIRSAYPELIHYLDVPDDPAVGNLLAGFRSMMAVPLFDGGEPLNWAISLSKEPEGFSVNDLEEAILRGNLVGGTVRNTIISKQLRDANERIRLEMESVAKIQRSLLPQMLPHVPGLTIATSYETFDTAGGDLYDFIQLKRAGDDSPPQPDDPLAMLIADASGHGPAASVVTAMLNSILYAHPPGHVDDPASVLAFANRHLYAKRLEGTFVTAFLCAYDPRSRTLTYARAGHNPPVVKNAGAGGSVFRLDDVGGIPLGVTDDATFENSHVKLKSGQTLVMYTDGITEGMNPQREMFGLAGIEKALHLCSGEPACVVNSINTALREHEAGVRPSDDQTIVAVKVE